MIKTDPSIFIYTRSGNRKLEKGEKPVLLPAMNNDDPIIHIWTEAHFVIDTMAEHALFMSLLLPPDAAKKEYLEAKRFHVRFSKILSKIDNDAAPAYKALKKFCHAIIEELKPFVDFKHRLELAQLNGTLHSLVWPLYFSHMREEAERAIRRFTQLAKLQIEYDRSEVTTFWSEIMEEHAKFTAHLLDPDEKELIEKCMNTSEVFESINKHGEIKGAVQSLFLKTGTLVESLIQNSESDAILSMAESILDFKTKAARDIEAARIKSIIDPRLADHTRREAIKFIDELKRAR